jgi:hypothetical protein
VETVRVPKVSSKPKRDIYARRFYAAGRAAIAIERVSCVAASGSLEEKARALRWMQLWIAFAASRCNAILVRNKKPQAMSPAASRRTTYQVRLT